MDTIGERLEWAIKEHGPRAPRNQGRPGAKGSIRQFYEQGLKDRPELKGKGASYQMLHRYLRDETAPPPEFMEAAADILKPVRRRWLETGEGLRTETAAAADAATDRAMPQQPALDREAILAAFRDEGGPVTHTPLLASHERLVLLAVIQLGLRDLSERADETLEMAAERHIDTARTLGRAVRAPLDALGLHPDRWPVPSRAQYLMQALGAMWGLEELEFYGLYTLRTAPEEEGDNGEA